MLAESGIPIGSWGDESHKVLFDQYHEVARWIWQEQVKHFFNESRGTAYPKEGHCAHYGYVGVFFPVFLKKQGVPDEVIDAWYAELQEEFDADREALIGPRG